MKRDARKAGRNLRQAVEGLGPLVKSLRELERDLAGIERQMDRVPADCEMPVVLERCQTAADRRFRALVGKAVEDGAASGNCRIILDAIGALAWRVGAELDTGPLPVTTHVWTDDDSDGVFYDPIPIGAPRQFAGAKYRLTAKLRLNPDGSLVRRPRRFKVTEE